MKNIRRKFLVNFDAKYIFLEIILQMKGFLYISVIYLANVNTLSIW